MHIYTVGVTEKLPLPFSVHRFERCSAFSVHGNDVHCFLAIRPAGLPFSEQTASNMIGYSLSNDWNAVTGTPAIGKFLPSDRIAFRLAAPDINAVSRRPLIG